MTRQICWKSSLIVSRDTLYMWRGNVRFPFIASLLPGGNGREIDRIGSRAENHYEKLFWRIAEFERPPPWNHSLEARLVYRIHHIWSMISAELYDNCTKISCLFMMTSGNDILSFLFVSKIKIIKMLFTYYGLFFYSAISKRREKQEIDMR